ncbi:MAG: hypothetical protein KAV00_02900 [Phycisphaerae bacterium]|nr:hypothetical protein [Phycisphaerae bacterium]
MFKAKTFVAVKQDKIFINDAPTYAGKSGVEGMLFNVRTVNSTFDDTLGKVDWWDDDGSHPGNAFAGYGKWASPDSAFANTERFIAALEQYKAYGILAVNLNFQGGHPLMSKKDEIPEGKGSAGSRPNGHRDFYHNSAFDSDGAIDPNYAKRIGDVIEACDRLGMVTILQMFYFGQDTVFEDEQGIITAVDNGVDFVCERGYQNVLIEIANETMQGHYHHPILKPGRTAELISRARKRGLEKHDRKLFVSTSEAAMLKVDEGSFMASNQWTTEEVDRVFQEADFILLHGGDGIEVGKVGSVSLVASKVDYFHSQPWFTESPKPIIFNESNGNRAFESIVERGASFGLHSNDAQTVWPAKWGVWQPEHQWFFDKTKALTETP